MSQKAASLVLSGFRSWCELLTNCSYYMYNLDPEGGQTQLGWRVKSVRLWGTRGGCTNLSVQWFSPDYILHAEACARSLGETGERDCALSCGSRGDKQHNLN